MDWIERAFQVLFVGSFSSSASPIERSEAIENATREVVRLKEEKDKGNAFFLQNDLHGAIKAYTASIDSIKHILLDRNIWYHFTEPAVNEMFSVLCQLLNNRAICYFRVGFMQGVLADTAAVVHACNFPRLIYQPPLRFTKTVHRAANKDPYYKALARQALAYKTLGNTAKSAEIYGDIVGDRSKMGLRDDPEAVNHYARLVAVLHPSSSFPRFLRL